MTEKTLSVLGWSTFAVLLVAAGALLLPACGLRLGPIDVAWCAPPVQAAAATPPDDIDDLLREVQALEDALIARPLCDPPPARRAEAPPPPPPPEPEAPQAGDDLVLPEDDDDLSFLRGCWESPQNGNIFQTGTNIRIQIRYCFSGSDGSGTVEILDSRDGDCRGPMQARREGDRLLIDYERAICERNGGSFAPGVIECRQGAQQVTCDIIEVRNGRREPRGDQVQDATLQRVD